MEQFKYMIIYVVPIIYDKSLEIPIPGMKKLEFVLSFNKSDFSSFLSKLLIFSFLCKIIWRQFIEDEYLHELSAQSRLLSTLQPKQNQY